MKATKRFKTFFRARERELVKVLEKTINKKYPGIYTQIDTDSAARVFKSGWDILFSANGKIIFCECKHVEKPPKTPDDVLKLLRPFQNLTRLKVTASKSPYWVVVFYGDGTSTRILLNTSPALVDVKTGELIEYIIERLKGKIIK